MHYQIAETPEMTGPQFQAKAAQVKKLIAQRKTHQATDFKAQAAKPGTHRESSAELDRLRAENATLRAKLATSKPAPAKPATLTAAAYLASVARPTMTRAQFSRLPRGEQGKAIKTITLVP